MGCRCCCGLSDCECCKKCCCFCCCCCRHENKCRPIRGCCKMFYYLLFAVTKVSDLLLPVIRCCPCIGKSPWCCVFASVGKPAVDTSNKCLPKLKDRIDKMQC